MKILFLMYTSFDTQFASRHILLSIIESLCNSGHHVHVVQKNMIGSDGKLPDEIKGYDVTISNIPFKNANKKNLVARYISDLVYTYKAKKYFRKEYDALFLDSTNVLGYVVKEVRNKLQNIKIIYTAQDIFPDNAKYRGVLKEQSLIYRTFDSFQKYAYKNIDNIIVISEDMKKTMIENGVSEKSVDVIYNWSYQDEVYDKNKLDLSQVKHIIDDRYFNVVYAGNIGVMQNVDILVSAAAMIKDDKNIMFHIIGDGVYKQLLEKNVKEKKLTNICFWPMQSSELAPLIYCAADVNIIPLAKNIYKTALPSKTATCLACQKPIIFALGKESEFGYKVNRETGCPIIESDDVEMLIKCIYDIKNNKIKINTKKFFEENFQKSSNSEKYEKIITSI